MAVRCVYDCNCRAPNCFKLELAYFRAGPLSQQYRNITQQRPTHSHTTQTTNRAYHSRSGHFLDYTTDTFSPIRTAAASAPPPPGVESAPRAHPIPVLPARHQAICSLHPPQTESIESIWTIRVRMTSCIPSPSSLTSSRYARADGGRNVNLRRSCD